jgi:hypothetical protein
MIFSAVLKTFAGIEYDYVNSNIGVEDSLFDNSK